MPQNNITKSFSQKRIFLSWFKGTTFENNIIWLIHLQQVRNEGGKVTDLLYFDVQIDAKTGKVEKVEQGGGA